MSDEMDDNEMMGRVFVRNGTVCAFLKDTQTFSRTHGTRNTFLMKWSERFSEVMQQRHEAMNTYLVALQFISRSQASMKKRKAKGKRAFGMKRLQNCQGRQKNAIASKYVVGKITFKDNIYDTLHLLKHCTYIRFAWRKLLSLFSDYKCHAKKANSGQGLSNSEIDNKVLELHYITFGTTWRTVNELKTLSELFL